MKKKGWSSSTWFVIHDYWKLSIPRRNENYSMNFTSPIFVTKRSKDSHIRMGLSVCIFFLYSKKKEESDCLNRLNSTNNSNMKNSPTATHISGNCSKAFKPAVRNQLGYTAFKVFRTLGSNKNLNIYAIGVFGHCKYCTKFTNCIESNVIRPNTILTFTNRLTIMWMGENDYENFYSKHIQMKQT